MNKYIFFAGKIIAVQNIYPASIPLKATLMPAIQTNRAKPIGRTKVTAERGAVQIRFFPDLRSEEQHERALSGQPLYIRDAKSLIYNLINPCYKKCLISSNLLHGKWLRSHSFSKSPVLRRLPQVTSAPATMPLREKILVYGPPASQF